MFTNPLPFIKTPTGIYTYSDGFKSIAVSLKIRIYPDNNSLCIGLVNVNDDKFLNSLTVNIGSVVPPYHAYVNVGLNNVREFIKENSLGHPINIVARINDVEYPLYKFSRKSLFEAYPLEIYQYEVANEELIDEYNNIKVWTSRQE